ncbi:MAG: efflux RND transporter permease subunit [Longimicrobiales bacterium]
MSIPKASIGRPVAVAMAFIAVVILGVLSFTRLPVDLLPDIAYPKLVIYTTYPGVAPAEIERFLSRPIESVTGQVPGLERVESSSREGTSLVTLRFAWGTNMDFAALNVREQLDGLTGSLPQGAKRPIVLRTDPRSEPIMAISASGAELWDLKELSESVFRRRLEQIDGIAQASVTGGLEREIHVDVNPRQLEALGVTIDQISNALASANVSAPSGTIMRGRFRYALRTLGEFQRVDQLASIVVSQQSGNAQGQTPGRVLLSDVATVEDGFEERESIARFNGHEAVGLLVFKESGANTVRVAEKVDEVLAQLRTQYPQLKLEVASSQAGFVSDAIANLVQEMILGAILAFLVLVVFLRDARYPFAISLAIPISIIGSFALLQLAGMSINIMTLGGLALGAGMLVDNSIVVIENIFRHREEKGLMAAAAAAMGTEEVQRAITASTLTTIAVFGPIIYVEGVAGQLFAALSMAVAFSLMMSLIVAVTLLPAIAARWDVHNERTVHAGFIRNAFDAPLRAFDRGWARFEMFYHKCLDLALSHRWPVLGGSVLIVLATFALAFSLPRSVLPDVDQGEFRARITMPRGTPLEITESVAISVESAVRRDKAVAAVFSRIGRQVALEGVTDEESGLHTATLEVRLKSGESTADAIARIRPALASQLKGGQVTLETGHATALGKLLGGGEADLAVRIRGEDLDSATAYAAIVQRKLSAMHELTNVRMGTEVGQPEFQIEIDRERAAAFGILPDEVSSTVASYMRGKNATDFVAFDRKVPIVVRLPDEARRDLQTMQLIRLRGVQLSELIHVREAVGPVEIQRVDRARVVPVYADVAGTDVTDAVTAIRTALADSPPPSSMRVDIGGENEEMDKSFRDLGVAFLLAIILVYMILAAEFESLLHPFTVMLAVPLSLIGAFVALWLFGSGVNAVSLIGLIILVGIVDNDAVVKIDFINMARAQGMTTREAIYEAGRARLRPIVMNSITTMLAIMPMMFGIGAGASLQAPMAVAVFGGLLTATALTLIVIPVCYEMLDELQDRLFG